MMNGTVGKIVVHKGRKNSVAVVNLERLCVNHSDQKVKNLMNRYARGELKILSEEALQVVMCLASENDCDEDNLDQITMSLIVHGGPKKGGLIGYDSIHGLVFFSREVSIALADVAPGTTVFFCDTKDWECRDKCTGECKHSGQFVTFEANQKPFSKFVWPPANLL